MASTTSDDMANRIGGDTLKTLPYQPVPGAGNEADVNDDSSSIKEQSSSNSRPHRSSSIIAVMRKTTLATVFSANFTVYTALSILSAFFPVYAEKQLHASTLMVGVIFAAHPISEIMFTPVASLLCKRWGRSEVFRFGLVALAAGVGMFGLSSTISAFLWARVLEGVGSSFVQVAGLALLLENTDNIMRDIAIQEMMSGIGYAVGPLLGGLLYQALGMAIMYIAFAMVPLVILFLHMQTSWVSTDELDQTSYPEVEESVNWRVLLHPVLAAASLSITVTAASYGFLDLTLSAHMNQAAGFSPAQAGVIYIVPPLIYALFSFYADRVVQVLGAATTISIGLFMSTLGYILIGPAPFLHLDLSQNFFLALVVFALTIMGIGESLILIPAIPVMLDCIEELEQMKDVDPNDIVAGLFNFAWCLGDFVGPLIGGFFVNSMPKSRIHPCAYEGSECLSSFNTSAFVFGLMLLLPIILTYYSNKRHQEQMLSPKTPKVVDDMLGMSIRKMAIPEEEGDEEAQTPVPDTTFMLVGANTTGYGTLRATGNALDSSRQNKTPDAIRKRRITSSPRWPRMVGLTQIFLKTSTTRVLTHQRSRSELNMTFPPSQGQASILDPKRAYGRRQSL